MPIWIVRAIWQEDEGEATKEEAIEAESSDEAIRRFLPQLRFPHTMWRRACGGTARAIVKKRS